MEDEQIIPGSATAHVKDSPQNTKVIWIVMAVVAVIGVSLISYVMGKNSNKVNDLSISPTPEPTVAQNTPTVTEKPISGTVTPTIKTKILSSTPSLDGFRSSNNGGNNTLEVRAGRNDTLVTRGFLSFSLSDIPAGSVVTEATLRLYQGQIVGNPYGVGGSVKVDHLNYGDSLDQTDYGMAALTSSFVTLTSNASVEWKDALVTAQVKDDIANARSRAQFRLHFSTEVTGGTVTGDFAYFEASDNNMGTGNTPQLVVKYY